MTQAHDRVVRAQTGTRGTVQYVGVVQHSPDEGEYVGVTWDDPTEGGGKYDGEIYGVRYFDAPPKSSSFLKTTRLQTAEPLRDVLLQRYRVAEQHTRHIIESRREANEIKTTDKGDEKSGEDAERRSPLRATAKAPPGEAQPLSTKGIVNVHAQKTVLQAADGSFPFLKNVSAAGMKVAGCDGIGVSFPNIVDLNLSYTLISRWSDVGEVLAALPCLQTLSLSGNRFEPLDGEKAKALESRIASGSGASRLLSLSLANTRIGFSDVSKITSFLPSLTDLNCSANTYASSDVSLHTAFPALLCLRLESNGIACWKTLTDGLRQAPSLEALYLSENPLAEITPGCRQSVPSLKRLYLRKSSIAEWGCVDQLAGYDIVDLSMVEVPLTDPLTSHERRCLLIARVPSLKVLNRGSVSNSERENSERFAVRHFHGQPNPPEVVLRLREKHGDLLPLSDVDLSPQLTASVTVVYLGHTNPTTNLPQETPVVLNVRDTVAQVAKTLCKPMALDVKSVRLTHVDPDVAGTPHERQALELGRRMLYTYRIKDGDIVEVASCAEGGGRQQHTTPNGVDLDSLDADSVPSDATRSKSEQATPPEADSLGGSRGEVSLPQPAEGSTAGDASGTEGKQQQQQQQRHVDPSSASGGAGPS
eukprot:TRINITY_DN35868_c0_g1_i1.p1 TRINITY_DN35868_c0_g1~~TRINITY_DN35868_c0_g1_i1.p1  ORF type:complete len:646 (+),score=108.83 TRINITY_DN35868_c0_g1_i1:298-2235(+)